MATGVRPYVIKQGDFLLKIAHQYGFDADTAWTDARNANLRAERPDPNILLPGDVLQIPVLKSKSSSARSLAVGASNSFVSEVRNMTLTHQFVGADETAYATKQYRVEELPELTGLSTADKGVATFQAPVTCTTVTIVFVETGESWMLRIGTVDPINTLSGIFKRLQTLGYIGPNLAFREDNPTSQMEQLRDGLLFLKASVSPEDADSQASDDADSLAKAAGLRSDGTLDDATAQLLVDACGC